MSRDHYTDMEILNNNLDNIDTNLDRIATALEKLVEKKLSKK